MLLQDSYLKYIFWTFHSSKYPKKFHCFQKKKKLSRTTAFNFDNKNHVTLKTEVMMLKIHLSITGINYILKYIKIVSSYFV